MYRSNGVLLDMITALYLFFSIFLLNVGVLAGALIEGNMGQEVVCIIKRAIEE